MSAQKVWSKDWCTKNSYIYRIIQWIVPGGYSLFSCPGLINSAYFVQKASAPLAYRIKNLTNPVIDN